MGFSAPAVVVLVEAEAGSAGAFGGVAVGGGQVLGVGVFLADADQALQAAPGALERGALLWLGRGAGGPFPLGGQLRLAPAVAGACGAVEGHLLLEASGGGRRPVGVLRRCSRRLGGVLGEVGVLVDRGRTGAVGGGRGRAGEAWLHRCGPGEIGVALALVLGPLGCRLEPARLDDFGPQPLLIDPGRLVRIGGAWLVGHPVVRRVGGGTVAGTGGPVRPGLRRNRAGRFGGPGLRRDWTRSLGGPGLRRDWTRSLGGPRLRRNRLPFVGRSGLCRDRRVGLLRDVRPLLRRRLIAHPVVGEQGRLLLGGELVVEVDSGGVLDVALLVGDLEAVGDLGGVDQGDEGLVGAEQAGVDQGPGGVAGLSVEVELADRAHRGAVAVDDRQRPPAVQRRRVEGRHGRPPCARHPRRWGDANPHCPPSTRLNRAKPLAAGYRSAGQSGADCSSSRPRVSGRRANRTQVRTTGAQISTAAVAKLSRASVSRPKATRPATAPATPAATSQPATVARTLVGNSSEPRAPNDGA